MLESLGLSELTALLSGGRHAARKLKRAQILLAADAGACDDDIATSVGVGGSTVYRTKQRFVLDNLEAALSEEPRPGAIPVASENRTVTGIGLPLNSTARLSPAASGDALKLPSTTMPLA